MAWMSKISCSLGASSDAVGSSRTNNIGLGTHGRARERGALPLALGQLDAVEAALELRVQPVRQPFDQLPGVRRLHRVAEPAGVRDVRQVADADGLAEPDVEPASPGRPH